MDILLNLLSNNKTWVSTTEKKKRKSSPVRTEPESHHFPLHFSFFSTFRGKASISKSFHLSLPDVAICYPLALTATHRTAVRVGLGMLSLEREGGWRGLPAALGKMGTERRSLSTAGVSLKLDLMKLLFSTPAAGALAQAVHRGWGCSILGNIQGQLGAGL